MILKPADFLFELLATGQSVFTLKEMTKALNASRKSAIEILARLAKHKRIVSLTTGLYALVHPSECKHGIRPLHVIDAIMRHRKSDYYVGLLSAADYWGAAHQKPMCLQVMVPRQLTMRKQGALKVLLHVKKRFLKQGIVQGTTETGRFNISSPLLTALDIITYESACGGLDNVFMVIQDLLPKIVTKDLKSLVSTYRPITSIQRFGYLLQLARASRAMTRLVEKVIIKQKPTVVLLAPSLRYSGKTNQKWRIRINYKIETQHDF